MQKTNGSPKYKITLIDTREIKFFLRRGREPGAYGRLKESIREIGLKIPISVRDISDWPKSDRRRQEEGGWYRYELICGQGRLQAFRDLEIEKIPAIVHDVAEAEIVGRFLAENVMRRKLSWIEKAQLIKYDLDVGSSVEVIAKKYFVTRNHVLRYLRNLKAASKEVLEQASKKELSIQDVEVLTGLSPEHQNIVVEVLKEEGLSGDSLQPLVHLAKDAAKKGKLSKGDLKGKVNTLRKQRRESRDTLRLYRKLHCYGPENVRQLLEMPEVRHALDRSDIDYREFLSSFTA